jgi:tRNA (pseudouridine54-N1)-methyltransferase
MDLLTRSVNAGFCISHDIRRDVEVALVLLGPEDPPKAIRFVGSELKYLNPDERSTGALIRNALVKIHEKNKQQHSQAIEMLDQKHKTSNNINLEGELKASPGIYISNNGLDGVLKFYSKKFNLIYVHEGGLDISETELTGECAFILSDDKNFTEDEDKKIKEYTKLKISLGPIIIHTDQCITVIHNNLDRA